MSRENHFECLQEIARLNNQGAACLASGDDSNAIKAFKSCLALMQDIAGTADLSLFSSQMSSAFTSVEVPGLTDEVFYLYIYNRALFLKASPYGPDLSDANAIVLFNLAMVFHQRGMLCGQEVKLHKAVHLYDFCTKLIEGTTSSMGALVMAALNNQAQIHFSLCNYLKSVEMAERIRLVSEHVQFPSPNMTSAFEQHHFDEIYLNLLIFTQPPNTAASA